LNHILFISKSITMNYQAALLQLSIPNDCAHIINSYLFLDKQMYTLRLIKKSVNQLMRFAVSPYNDERYDVQLEHGDVYFFRWYPMHTQHQIQFCTRCGKYKQVNVGRISQCCSCECV